MKEPAKIIFEMTEKEAETLQDALWRALITNGCQGVGIPDFSISQMFRVKEIYTKVEKTLLQAGIWK